jgi:flagellar protein FlaI
MPQESKVVSIEDTRELRIEHENWIPGVARLGFSGTKVGEVSMFDLLKEAFRQNPNYLIVGEVRGEEAAVMFQAMASGITSMSTMHAGSVEDALKRLQTRPISLPPTLMETLDVMVIMARAVEKGASARRVRHIIEIESVDPATNQVKYTEAFAWDPAKDVYHKKKESIVFRKIAQEKGLTVAGIEKDILQRRQFLKWLASQDLDWKQVAEYLVLYKRNRTKALEAMKG